MKAQTAVAIVVVAVVAALFGYCVGARSRVQPLVDKDRETLAVLIKDGSQCRGIKTDPARALRKDKFVFRIVDASCGLDRNTKLRVHFVRSNSAYEVPDAGKGKDIESDIDAKRERRVRLTIDQFAGNPPADGFWWFEYEIQYFDSGANTWMPLVDPRLEVDP